VTAGQPELEELRSRVQQLDSELQEAKVSQGRHNWGEEKGRCRYTRSGLPCLQVAALCGMRELLGVTVLGRQCC
jgi:hypothetical protein